MATAQSSSSQAATSGAQAGSTADRSSSSAVTTGSTVNNGDAAALGSPSRDSSYTHSSTLKHGDRRFISRAAECSQKEIAASELAAERAASPQIRNFAQQVSSEHRRLEQELAQLAQSKGVTLENMQAAVASGSPYGVSAAGRATDSGLTASSDVSSNSGIATDHGAPRATGAAGTAGTGASSGMATNSSTATSDTGRISSSSRLGVNADLSDDRHVRSLARKTGQEFDRDYVDLMVDAHEDSVKLFQRAAKDAQDADVRSFASSHLATLQAHLEQANSLMKSAAE